MPADDAPAEGVVAGLLALTLWGPCHKLMNATVRCIIRHVKTIYGTGNG